MLTDVAIQRSNALQDSTVVFALTLLVSSVVVYNLTSNIQEDDLMNLQTFASCGVQAQDDTDNPIAYQKLVFLVRDWGFPSTTPYGSKGQDVLDSVLEVSAYTDVLDSVLEVSAYTDVLESVLEVSAYTDVLDSVLEVSAYTDVLDSVLEVSVYTDVLDSVLEVSAYTDVLDSVLKIKEEQHPTHQDVRRDVRKCFEDLSCYLMPHVGLEALEKEDFDGCIAKLSKKFVEHLRLLVPALLAPKNLVKKKLGEQPVQAKELFNFFKTSMETFKNMDLLDFTTFVEITARMSSQKALEVAKGVYMSTMEQSLDINTLEEEHEKVKQKAIASFLKENKYGRKNQRVSEEYQTKLENEVDHVFKSHFVPLASSQAAKKAGLESYEKAMKERLAGTSLTDQRFETVHQEEMKKALCVYEEFNANGKRNLQIFNQFHDQLSEVRHA
ncbi:Guanylate-binding protein N-terminal [Trinorchestia longiramus]|nr:Guanylate-binding protein N-terminal [Trinorchestia longiramus]